MRRKYRKNKAAREAQGIPPLPFTAEQTSQTCEMLRKIPEQKQETPPLLRLELLIVVLFLLGGLFYISLIDHEYRSVFADLTKMGVGAYVGWKIK